MHEHFAARQAWQADHSAATGFSRSDAMDIQRTPTSGLRSHLRLA
jgi:hypothetical protein